ncbi:Ankyrin repeat [Durusdinium trenchii]
MEFAAAGDNPEGVQLLHEAGGQLHVRSVMGFTALEIASCRGAASAMLEIVRLAKAEQLDFSGALWCALALKAEGGTASIVGWLLEHRADVNQSRNPWHSSLYGALACTKALQHRFGQQSKATRQFYHMWGATPLVMAMLESQYEGAATLIAAGAKLELCNSRGWSAADFIREQSVPDFLLQALAGNLEECKRVSTVAQSRGYAEKFC